MTMAMQGEGKAGEAARRVAIIGCGKIAGAGDSPANPHITTHARAIQAHAGYRLHSCCDPDPQVVRAFSDKWGCARGFTDVRELLREGGDDLYVVASSTPSHASILRALLAEARPLTVICEKPLVEHAQDWRSLAASLARSRHTLLVNYPRRFDAAHQKLRDYLEEGILGGLQTFHAKVAKGLVHNGCHMVDLLLYLLGGIHSLRPVSLRPFGNDLAGTVLCRLDSGVEGTLVGVESPEYSLFELDLVFTRGKVEIRKIGHDISVFQGVPSPIYPGFSDLEKTVVFPATFHEAFLGIYRGLADPVFEPAGHWVDALRGMDLMMELLETGAAG
jgi:predicted dehydrogenase